jgi:hypothetical protein
MIDEWAKEQTHGKSLLYEIQAMITEKFLKLMSPGSCRLSSSIFCRQLRANRHQAGLTTLARPLGSASCYTRSTPSYKLPLEYNLLLAPRLTSYPLAPVGLC